MLTTPRSHPFSTVPCRIPAALMSGAARSSRAQSMEGRFQPLPLQFPARLRDHFLPLAVIERRRLLRCPGQHGGELLTGRRALLPAPPPAGPQSRPRGPPSPSPNRHRHRRASVACRGSFSVHHSGTGPGTGGTGNRAPARKPPPSPPQPPLGRASTTVTTRSRNIQALQISTALTWYRSKSTTVTKTHPHRTAEFPGKPGGQPDRRPGYRKHQRHNPADTHDRIPLTDPAAAVRSLPDWPFLIDLANQVASLIRCGQDCPLSVKVSDPD